ncbi:ribonuclease III [Opitutales bacterium]|nr:ribonuclease III [Opitutales bacterium]
MSDKENLLLFQEQIGYRFEDESLLLLALTHPSYHEHDRTKSNNQRLEFLGDSILSLILTDELYHKFPHADEGELTQRRASLIRGESLTGLARQIKIDSFILLSVSDRKNNGHLRDSTLEDAMEALIGAIYLDGGLGPVRDLVLKWITQFVGKIEENEITHNPKGRLQEWIQENMADAKIKYQISKESGPAHNKHFEAEILIKGKVHGFGVGKSKKAAENIAALKAFEFLCNDKREQRPAGP